VIGPRELAKRVRRWPFVYRAGRRTWEAVNDVLPPRRLDELGLVHRNDLMLEAARPELMREYQELGQAAVLALRDGHRAASPHPPPVRSVFDFGCGHGRVTRQMRTTFSDATVFVCDLDARAAEWVGRTFGAQVVKASLQVDEIDLPEVDLTWLGSVITHLDASVVEATLRALLEHTRPGGVVVASYHGLDILDRAGQLFDYISAERAAALQEEVRRSGFTYMSYPHYSGEDYGLSFNSEEWLRALAARIGARVVPLDVTRWGPQSLMALTPER
jgi:SAM-dependent methyltransferase